MSEPTRISFEFFPPRSAAQTRRFWRSFGALEPLAPAHVSLTWGALGADSGPSLELLEVLVRETDIPITAHLSCIGRTKGQLRATLDTLESFGVGHVLALRGDAPADVELGRDALRYASELVTLLAEERPHLEISVAGYPEAHPESRDAAADLHWLRHKLERGAARAVTQFFFEPEVYLRWRDRARASGIDKPLVPGILPVHDIDKVKGFAAKCGAAVPARLVERLARARDAESRRALAIEQCLELCRALEREGVDEFHLYTLNRAELAHAVAAELLGDGASRAVAA